MNKLIIIEGQDNCGKSTLIRNLRKKISNPKIMSISSSSPPIDYNEYWSNIHYDSVFSTMSDLFSKGFTLLVDRFHIGETCYGSYFRNDLTQYIWDIESKYLNDFDQQIYLIVIVDDGINIVNRDDGLSIESNVLEFDAIHDLFVKGYDKSNIKHKLLINVSDGWADVDKIYNWIYGE